MGRKESFGGGSTAAAAAAVSKRKLSFSLAKSENQGASPSSLEASAAIDDVRALFENLLQWRDASGKTLLHHDDLALTSGFLKRLRQLASMPPSSEPNAAGGAGADGGAAWKLHREYLTVRDDESGYTPLHWAAYRRDLAAVLLLLRHAASANDEDDYAKEVKTKATRTSALLPPKLKKRPMELLLSSQPSSEKNPSCSDPSSLTLTAVLEALDHEHMTGGDLLVSLSRDDLMACRLLVLPRPKLRLAGRNNSMAASHHQRRQRRVSFDADGDHDEDEQDEFDLLSRNMQLLSLQRRQQQQQQQQHEGEDQEQPNGGVPQDGQQGGAQENQNGEENQEFAVRSDTDAVSSSHSYACEVFTFGSAHHCALGVGQDSSPGSVLHDSKKSVSRTVRPHRVEAFALGETRLSDDGSGPAVAVAGAAHHTLVTTEKGHLYAFGLGKNGRLGTGSEQHSPLPTRIMGALHSRRVVVAAAAENHSLCVTDQGEIFSWGSNSYGQLGISCSCNDGDHARFSPRRVDDLKNEFCVSVAAGAKHSLALSRAGHVYGWGSNVSGQLAFVKRTHNGRGHRVQLISALATKVMASIAASEESSMALGLPAEGSLVNSVYCWGHGNHVPARIHFDSTSRHTSISLQPQRAMNPVAIACARFHYVAITSDGRVLVWNTQHLHSDSLGTTKSKRMKGSLPSSASVLASPQLVTGMLPENGGGIAVSVSASDNHTAVITDTGALYTWGATSGKNVLGHEGLRWQPEPRRVPGVSRAVGVAAAKEHTILLVATTFPPLPRVVPTSSLELLAARKVAEHVDMFNVLICLIMASRADCVELMNYCRLFLQHNLDGVLTVSQKSVLDCYLDEQLISCLLPSKKDYCDSCVRDQRHHPCFTDIILSGVSSVPFDDPFADEESWLKACRMVAGSDGVKTLAEFCSHVSSSEFDSTNQRPRSFSEVSQDNCSRACSSRCLELTVDMDLSSVELAEAKQACLAKELRGLRKRLHQISKLEECSTADLSSEQRNKISRRPQLEADLLLFEPALATVEKRLGELCLVEEKAACQDRKDADGIKAAGSETDIPAKGNEAPKQESFRCHTCQITCPDVKSYALHMSGRKHRNRVTQEEEQEKKSVAAAMMAEKLTKQLTREEEVVKRTPVKIPPWQKGSSSPLQPPSYSLPVPPIPPPDSIVTKPKRPVSFREIMKEESDKGARMRDVKSPRLRPRPNAISGSSHTRPTVKLKDPPPEVKSQTSPLMLPKNSAPPLKTPPWASAPAAKVAAEQKVASAAPSTNYSLADFISPTSDSNKQLQPPPQSSPRIGAWCTPKAAAEPSTSPGINLRDIQLAEKELKSRQDQSVREDGKWFVERRMRAANLKDIQERDAKEREERLFIEEQYLIEKQIEEERTAAAAAVEQAKKKGKRRNPGERKKNNRNSNKGQKKASPPAIAARKDGT